MSPPFAPCSFIGALFIWQYMAVYYLPIYGQALRCVATTCGLLGRRARARLIEQHSTPQTEPTADTSPSKRSAPRGDPDNRWGPRPRQAGAVPRHRRH